MTGICAAHGRSDHQRVVTEPNGLTRSGRAVDARSSVVIGVAGAWSGIWTCDGAPTRVTKIRRLKNEPA